MPKITVRSHFPYSDEFTWITEMVDIDLDEERIKDVVSGRGFIIKSPKPIKEDLKDPDGIFSNKYGPTLDDINPYQDRYKCECGYMRGKVNNEQVCPICHTKVKYVDDNFGYFGWAVLKEPYHVIHPSLFITLSKFIDNDTFLNIIKFSKEIDKDGNIAETKAPKNEPYYGIGMMGFYDKFEEIMEYYANKYKSKSKQEYYQVLMDAGKKKIFTHSIPIFTTLLRPYRVEGGDLHYEGINAIYKLLVALFANVSNDTNKIDKKEIIQNKLLYDAQMKIKELFDEIIKIFSGKKGSRRDAWTPMAKSIVNNLLNCWKFLKKYSATTWLETASVICLKNLYIWIISSQIFITKKGEKSIMNELLMELIKICDKFGLDVDGDVFTATSLYGQAEIFINAKKGVIRVIDRG